MNELTILIIGIGIGYFWAMFRVDNIKVRTTVTTLVNARELFDAMSDWAGKNGYHIVASEKHQVNGTLTEKQETA